MSVTPPQVGQWSPKRFAAELQWLQDHPEFEQRPATIKEFVGEHYLNIEDGVRPAVMEALQEMIGKKVRADRITAYQKAMFTGGIGIGKTTIASIVLPYLAHWVLCLKDPQKFFGLLPGSRIAFMQMSTSGDQAKEVVFGDIKARIEYSPWFQQNYRMDPKFKNQIRFEKSIWILPGDSEETTFEGYNILGGILDEADSHKVTKAKDYAEQGYTTIFSRVTSRFQDRGFILVIGQMKRANGFAARKYTELKKDPTAYTVRMSIWESFGWQKYIKPDGTRDSFWYDPDRKEIVPTGVVKLKGGENLIEVPTLYRQDFDNNPEKALRDLAGIPPATGSPFISMAYRIIEAREEWHRRHGEPVPVEDSNYLPKFADWWRAPDNLKRVCHIDMAFSSEGDALGFAMGHVPEVVELDGERKPFIVFDCIVSVRAPAGRAVHLADIRRMIYDLRDERKFRIVHVTMDGFQSTDTQQQLERRRITTEQLSVDKSMHPYFDLREAIYERRIAFPKYMIRLRPDDVEYTEIAYKELSELVDNGNKIDHPEGGSKDVADAMAGVCYNLMGNRSYHARRLVSTLDASDTPPATGDSYEPPIGRASWGTPDAMSAPIPPALGDPFVWRPPGRR